MAIFLVATVPFLGTLQAATRTILMLGFSLWSILLVNQVECTYFNDNSAIPCSQFFPRHSPCIELWSYFWWRTRLVYLRPSRCSKFQLHQFRTQLFGAYGQHLRI